MQVRVLASVLFLTWWVSGAGLAADQAASLRERVMDAPEVRAARERHIAEDARRSAAGRFADPELEGMYSIRSLAAEDVPMWELSLRQPLPRAGERSAVRRMAAAMADRAGAEVRRVAGRTAAAAATAIAEADAARLRGELLAVQIRQVERTAAALDSRVGTGTARMATRLALDSRVAAMQLMAAKEARMQADAESEVRALLGLVSGDPLPAFAAPAVADILPERTPDASAADFEARVAVARSDEARAGRRPMTAVGVRFEREDMPDEPADTIGIAFMTELPWRARGYARADMLAADAEGRAAAAEGDMARRETVARLTAVTRAAAVTELARKLAVQTGARIDAEYEALVRAAGNAGMAGEMPVLMLLDLLEQRTVVEREAIDAEAAERAARAALWLDAPAHVLASDGVQP